MENTFDVVYEGEVVKAKRFNDLTHEEQESSVTDLKDWEGNEIFLEPIKPLKAWRYMYDEEVEICEKTTGQSVVLG